MGKKKNERRGKKIAHRDQVLAGLSHNLQVSVSVLTRDGVEKDEVIKVGYLAALPALGHVGGLE